MNNDERIARAVDALEWSHWEMFWSKKALPHTIMCIKNLLRDGTFLPADVQACIDAYLTARDGIAREYGEVENG
jgi:hypothetical protein